MPTTTCTSSRAATTGWCRRAGTPAPRSPCAPAGPASPPPSTLPPGPRSAASSTSSKAAAAGATKAPCWRRASRGSAARAASRATPTPPSTSSSSGASCSSKAPSTSRCERRRCAWSPITRGACGTGPGCPPAPRAPCGTATAPSTSSATTSTGSSTRPSCRWWPRASGPRSCPGWAAGTPTGGRSSSERPRRARAALGSHSRLQPVECWRWPPGPPAHGWTRQVCTSALGRHVRMEHRVQEPSHSLGWLDRARDLGDGRISRGHLGPCTGTWPPLWTLRVFLGFLPERGWCFVLLLWVFARDRAERPPSGARAGGSQWGENEGVSGKAKSASWTKLQGRGRCLCVQGGSSSTWECGSGHAVWAGLGGGLGTRHRRAAAPGARGQPACPGSVFLRAGRFSAA